MQFKLFLPTALLTTLSLAQTNNFNLNTEAVSHSAPCSLLFSLTPSSQATRVVADIENYVQTLAEDPVFQTDVAAILSVIPSSIINAAQVSPEALIDQLQTNTAMQAYITAIPTSVLDSLETLAAKPIQAAEDVGYYLEGLSDDPEVSAALAVLETAVPTSVQLAIQSDPVAFAENVLTATAIPGWASDIPAPVQSQLGNAINSGLSIVAANLEATGMATVASSGMMPMATGAGSANGVSSNTTMPTTGPAAPFEGAAAASLKSVGAGAVALVGAVGVLVML